MRICLLLILLLLIQGESQKDEDYIRIISWNIKGFGNKETSQLIKIAEILQEADIVAIQEVPIGNGPKKLEELVAMLNISKAKWSYIASDSTRSVNKGTKERYAYLWNKSRLDTVLEEELNYELDSLIHREPYLFRLAYRGKPIDLINVHVCKTLAGCPDNEILALSSHYSLQPSIPTIILGDFNSSQENFVFNEFKEIYESGLKSKKTILKNKCDSTGHMSSASDNFFYSKKIELVTAGIDLPINCENFESIKNLSDHLPIYMTFRIE